MREVWIALGLALVCACSAPPESPLTIAQQDANRRIAEFIEADKPGLGPLMLSTGTADLDGDGVDEVLVYAAGPERCGTGGCNLLVLKDDGKNFTKIGDISVTQLPLGVLDTSTNGMRDLAVTIYGGGIPQARMKVPFDGKSYAANATVAPAVQIAKLGTEVIADQPLSQVE